MTKIIIEEKFGSYILTANLKGSYARYEIDKVGEDYLVHEVVGNEFIDESDIRSILNVYGKLL